MAIERETINTIEHITMICGQVCLTKTLLLAMIIKNDEENSLHIAKQGKNASRHLLSILNSLDDSFFQEADGTKKLLIVSDICISTFDEAIKMFKEQFPGSWVEYEKS